MSLTRRRFLTVSAAFAALPASAQAAHWQGRAFGAEIAITIRGPSVRATPALAAARQTIRAVEKLFNLYDTASDLSRLNRDGVLIDPDPRFVTLCRLADDMHALTRGLFDPTVQPVWQALATGRAPRAAWAQTGWDQVTLSLARITLGQGQALTFNGIAQGFATDLVSDVLRAHGLDRTLVNIGEFRGTTGPWRLGIEDPEHGLLGQHTLTSGALASSSPRATQVAGQPHILHETAVPRWSTVTVEAASAAVADAASTALVLAGPDQIKSMIGQKEIRRILVVDPAGQLSSYM